MPTRLLLGALAAAGLLLGQSAIAQDRNPPRVGVILQGGPWYAVFDGLRDGLKQMGFVEGKQFVLEIRDTHGDLQAVEEAARNLEQRKVSLIYAVATSVSVETKRVTENVPIVFAAGTDPVAAKLVESIARPGGRLTGVHFWATDLMGKRLELLREIVPNLRRVVTFYNPGNRSAVAAAREAREAARNLGVEVIERSVTSVEELRNAVQAFSTNEADAYVAVSDAMIGSNCSRDPRFRSASYCSNGLKADSHSMPSAASATDSAKRA